MSKEKMIMFNGDMVRAILDGRKTQTRRPLRNQPYQDAKGNWCVNRRGVTSSLFRKNMSTGKMEPYSFDEFMEQTYKTPQPGDTMLARERARLVCINYGETSDRGFFRYMADGHRTGLVDIPMRLKPLKLGSCVPNGCFKELVRIKRKVLRVWFEQIQSISDKNILAEGVKCPISMGIGSHCGVNVPCPSLRLAYHELWDSVYPGSWDRNDWVECTEFDKQQS
jgi:hypothetical protein